MEEPFREKTEEKIARLEEEITKAPEVLKPMMRAVLSNWYWQYDKTVGVLLKTRTAEAREKTSPRGTCPILSEIDKQFQKTLSYHEVLKKQAIGDYDFLLIRNVPRAIVRPL